MLATVNTRLAFDGRDVTDTHLAARVADREVRGYFQDLCAACGTVRDARYPFCCELAADPRPARVLVAC